ncbi:MAG: Gfo/Idh/MocA family oxidoreductase [Bacteroidota bacterium]
MEKIRWGILATGKIAGKFAAGMQLVEDAELVAVGSRREESAKRFAKQYGIKKIHTSYEDLAADPEVDIIYVATPHPYHHDNTLMCLEAGKAVLCEKPIAINSEQSEAMIAKAKEKGLFLMEAMWTRFLPVWVQIKAWLEEGKIGEIKQVYADFGFEAAWNPEGRVLNPDLAGGAMLDVGIYPIAFAYHIFGQEPVFSQSFSKLGSTGVDEQSAYLLGYENGAFATLSSAVRVDSNKEASIIGTKGRIRIPLFWKSSEVWIEYNDGRREYHPFPYESSGLQYQAVHAMQCLREGRTESPVMPWAESLRIMRMMDRFRQQWGLRYPGE